ncbi:hypothetical protein L209DRAFT_505921 [Thermothelomyces heterothallicus CBS 203.75]
MTRLFAAHTSSQPPLLLLLLPSSCSTPNFGEAKTRDLFRGCLSSPSFLSSAAGSDHSFVPFVYFIFSIYLFSFPFIILFSSSLQAGSLHPRRS